MVGVNGSSAMGRRRRHLLIALAMVGLMCCLRASTAPRPREASARTATRPHTATPAALDTLVLLRYEGNRRYRLQAVTVDGTGRLTQGARVALPGGHNYSGPVMISPEVCLVLATVDSPPPDATAYQWRVGAPRVEQVGKVSRAYDYGWGLGLLGYTPRLRRALVSDRAPEGMADPPHVWTPGTDQWERPHEAYPQLGKRVKAAAWAACYSPDGRLLAVAVAGASKSSPVEVLILDLASHRVRRLTGPKHYVWALGISPDNSTLCWVDSRMPEALAAWAAEETPLHLGPYADAGIGVLSLKTGRYRYRRLSQEAGLPAELRGDDRGHPFIDQADSKVVFSGDGKRVYLPMSSEALVSLEVSSHRWRHIPVGYLKGFAVVPGS